MELLLDHVQIAAPPGAESEARRFYGELLGMRELPKPAALAKRGGAWFQCASHQIHIGIEQDFRPARKAHIALRAPSVQALNDLRARLTQAQVTVRDDDSGSGLPRFFADDPWGNRIEFLAPA